MEPSDLEARVAPLEAGLAQLDRIVEKLAEPEASPVMRYDGSWADDPAFDEAMKLGREYRESLRPKAPRRRKV